jgi:two-component system response regulator RegX3
MIGQVRVLLVEDDEPVAESLRRGLGRYGFEVEWVRTGADALAAGPAELVLLDLGLPDTDGLDVCRELRARGDVPIIVISARVDEVDRVVGLEIGADDYISKPFGVREVVARMRAVLRRTKAVPAGTSRPDSGTLDGTDRASGGHQHERCRGGEDACAATSPVTHCSYSLA